ncbi:hypothetical protein RND81_08G044300 [Saponaria officinalis]|uniref:Uncharacterized protein n=1 Tax=Saponaria officinalis TaxID=3572 RepID=A0AAW1J3Q0_SAPOF
MEKYEGINSVNKVKRKNFEEFTDDFCFFSPALKIRRLDAELPPIVEEENTDLTMRYEQYFPGNMIYDGVGDRLKMPYIEELPPSVPENEERAIVLFNPMNNPLSYPVDSFSVDPNLIATFKRQALGSMNVKTSEHSDEGDDPTDGDNEDVNACRAVVPWAPSYNPNLKLELPGSQPEVSALDAMDAEEPEATTMDIEDPGAPNVGQQTTDYHRLTSQWQQMHCMFPQPPQNTATPVVWYR